MSGYSKVVPSLGVFRQKILSVFLAQMRATCFTHLVRGDLIVTVHLFSHLSTIYFSVSRYNAQTCPRKEVRFPVYISATV
jgi:uncharacterized membrane protein YjjP (DUF1212 family)